MGVHNISPFQGFGSENKRLPGRCPGLSHCVPLARNASYAVGTDHFAVKLPSIPGALSPSESQMTISFRCPSCHTTFRVEDSSLGKIVICPNSGCNRKVTLPNAGVAELGTQREAHETVKPPALKFSAASQELESMPSAINGNSRSIVMLIALLLFIAVTGSLVTTFIVLKRAGKLDKFDELMAKNAPVNDQQPIEDSKQAEEADRVAAEAEKVEKDRVAAEDATAKATAKEEARIAAEAVEAKTKAEEARAAAVADEAKKRAELSDAEWQQKGPFIFIASDEKRRDSHGQWLFELPNPGDTTEPEPLKLTVKDQVVELALFKGAAHLFAHSDIQLELVQAPDSPDKWIVKANGNIELGEYTIERIPAANDAPANGAERSHDCLVKFQWLPRAARETAAAELLRWWPLQIRVGDRNAVLLQRTAFFFDELPTWRTLSASKEFAFPRTDELKVLKLNQDSPASFDLQITQAGHEPQKLSLTIGADEPAGEGDDDQNDDDPPNTEVRYFPLALPLILSDTPPSDAANSLGFGTLKMRLIYDEKKGLTFKPKMDITVRLPRKDLLNSFPSAGMLDELTRLSKAPTLFMKIAPNVDSIFAEARQEMTTNAKAMRTVVVTWHTQPLAKLLSKKSFDSIFEVRANAAIKTVRGVIPGVAKALQAEQNKLRKVIAENTDPSGNSLINPANVAAIETQEANVQAAEANFNSAKQYEPKVEEFTHQMQQLVQDVEQHITLLLQDYEAISALVKAFEDAEQEGQFQVRSRLSGQVETSGSDNGESLSLHFIASSSDVAP